MESRKENENDFYAVGDIVGGNLPICEETILVLGTDWNTVNKTNDSIRQSKIFS